MSRRRRQDRPRVVAAIAGVRPPPRAGRHPRQRHPRHLRRAPSTRTAAGTCSTALPGGPLIPGWPPPQVARPRPRRRARSAASPASKLLAADIIVTNFHSLGTGDDAGRPARQARPRRHRLHRRRRGPHRRRRRPTSGCSRTSRSARTLLMSRVLHPPRRQADRRRRRLPLPAHRLHRRRQRQEPARAPLRARHRPDHLRDRLARRPPRRDRRPRGLAGRPGRRAQAWRDHREIHRADPPVMRIVRAALDRQASCSTRSSRACCSPRSASARRADRRDRQRARHPLRRHCITRMGEAADQAISAALRVRHRRPSRASRS